MTDRVKCKELQAKICSAEEASLLIKSGMTIGTSGFTSVGYPKAVPMALAARASAGEDIRINLITGASVGDELDGELSRAGIISRRYPYQTNKSAREAINDGKIKYADMHLSNVPFWIKQNYFGKIDFAIIEAAAINEDGSIVPGFSIGCADTLVKYADKVIVEINARIPLSIEGFHDVYTGEAIPYTMPIPVIHPADRIGTTAISCSPDKVAAIVFCDIPDGNAELKPADDTAISIAENIVSFLKSEMISGRLPDPLPPIQSGVGGVANAVLSSIAKSDLENLTVYTEVMQDAVIELIEKGKVNCASGTALTVSPSRKAELYGKIEKFKGRIVIRPVEVSNSPEVIRRLGVIAMNTAIEADIAGNVNSTHINGKRLMNGIGGSGDYARNAGLSIFATASTAKNGTVSCIVPSVSHVDHTEHDSMIIVTEQGVADLRGLDPYERAELIINKCAHPDFRDRLKEYLKEQKNENPGHSLYPDPKYFTDK